VQALHPGKRHEFGKVGVRAHRPQHHDAAATARLGDVMRLSQPAGMVGF
jgi:hypothetical protein